MRSPWLELGISEGRRDVDPGGILKEMRRGSQRRTVDQRPVRHSRRQPRSICAAEIRLQFDQALSQGAGDAAKHRRDFLSQGRILQVHVKAMHVDHCVDLMLLLQQRVERIDTSREEGGHALLCRSFVLARCMVDRTRGCVIRRYLDWNALQFGIPAGVDGLRIPKAIREPLIQLAIHPQCQPLPHGPHEKCTDTALWSGYKPAHSAPEPYTLRAPIVDGAQFYGSVFAFTGRHDQRFSHSASLRLETGLEERTRKPPRS